MQNLLQEVEQLLKGDSRFTTDGRLLKNKVMELALHPDEQLIELLMIRPQIKDHFFIKAGGGLIFDKVKFASFISSQDFLPDSYTRFINRIGLASGDRFISTSKEVVLSFPYKDCILKGSQTRRESKREERFLNTTISPDEIERLLAPKVLTGFEIYKKDGCYNAEAVQITDNLIIKGNNLIVLHSVKQRFAGKVKLIYIDPPYNTGNDDFGYNDNFNHSSWLTFMKNRLEIAREFLAEDGAIFIQIDDGEMGYLRVLCDEIFGRENFKESISVKIGSESGVNAINVMRGEQLFKVKEHILYYAKNAAVHRFNPLYVKAISYNKSYRWEVIGGPDGYMVSDIYKKLLKEIYGQETLRGLTEAQKQYFEVRFENYCLQHAENIYALKLDIQKSGENFKSFAQKNKAKNIVESYQTSDGRTILVYRGGMLTALGERIVEENGQKYYGTLVSDFWWDIGATPSTEGAVKLKAGKKPERLLKRIIHLTTRPGDLVMDFFLGSGTTCAAAMKMGRQFIGIEQLDYGENDSIKRLQHVIGGDQTGISKDHDIEWKGGGSFIKCELLKLNQKFLERIQATNNKAQLEQLFEGSGQSPFISYRYASAMNESTLEEFRKLNITDQKRFLLEIPDKDFLYLNYSEIDDEDYGVTEEDKYLNHQFYNHVSSRKVSTSQSRT